MSRSAIRVSSLGKEYVIGKAQEKYSTLRDTLADVALKPVRALRSLGRRNANGKSEKESIWALRDVSFDVSHGEVIGIIGRNGAGKSTLLKILSRITEPTRGFAEIHGRVGSLLEVGTGFHPELTGRENITLNGAILGMTTSEIQSKFDSIVEFAATEKFIDTPVKHYSSGMHLRLAFAVAAHLEPEILLVDEVLAVGDAAFQKKCIGKMGEVAEDGRTVLFVSHNMAAVTSLCHRAIWIENGAVAADGSVDEVAEAYLQTLSSGTFNYFSSSHDLLIQRVILKNSLGEPTSVFAPGEDLVVEVWFDAKKQIERPFLFLKVQSIQGACFAANMRLDGNRPEIMKGEGRIICRFRSIPLLPQSYTIVMAMRASNLEPIVAPHEVASFSVAADLSEYGFKGDAHSLLAKSTPVVIPYEWVLPDGSTAQVELKTAKLDPETSQVETSESI